MRRFLVVGCGGSGGATLAYMMDQLRSDLGAYGFGLPAGWQFIHLDVPTGEEAGPEGLGNVAEQGGRYVECGTQGAQYAPLDSSVAGHPRVLDEIATWAPRRPESVTVPINVGAGQFRAIGRMITLAAATKLYERLGQAWANLMRIETAQEMTEIAAAVPGVGPFNAGEPPVVLVVSSMAGGSGASMALDVCRLLTLIPVTGSIGVFMYSADVFDSLPPNARPGVRGNSLAMAGEIIAAQSGAGRPHDQAMLGALGLNSGYGVTPPFARVFPISRRVGLEHTPFGDGRQNTVYRGLARGLAGLMMSQSASDGFVAYDLGNTGQLSATKDTFGWGLNEASWDPMPWGAFGYACLSTGRERFGEYAAQRIARGAVNRLVTGHLAPGSTTSSVEQLKALLDSQWESACLDMRLPRNSQEFMAWLTTVVFADAHSDAQTIMSAEVMPYLTPPAGQNGPQFLNLLRTQLVAQRARLSGAAEQTAYRRAYAWHQELADVVQRVVADRVARHGLPFGVALIDRLETHLRNLLVPGAQNGRRRRPEDISAVPTESESSIGAIRGVVANGQQVMSALLDNMRQPIRAFLVADGCRLIEQFIPGFITEYLAPLRAALIEALTLLELKRDPDRTPLADVGLARLQTDQYLAWPSDDNEQVPARFTHALNDVLLIKADDFDEAFQRELVASVEQPEGTGFPGSPSMGLRASFDSARQTVLGQVIAGEWSTTGGTQPPRNLLEQTADWHTRAFAQNPHTQQLAVPQAARFDLHTRTEEVLARARMYVERPGASFDNFVKTSLRSMISGTGSAAAEQRRQEVIAAFTEALGRARPMISVDEQAVRAVHSTTSAQYRFKFSDVPFGDLPIAGDLIDRLKTNSAIDAETESIFATALRGRDCDVSRIDIFGSYANFSPIVFDAVLTPASDEWAATPAAGKDDFWRWRRSRPLPASLPMGDAERRAMIGGWFTGLIVGELRMPSPPFDDHTGPAEIWDGENGRWLAFPDPMLTPPTRFLAEYDWLPAVLESSLLAFAGACRPPVFESMRPYQLLRAIYDESKLRPTAVSSLTQSAAERRLVTWLRNGDAPGRAPSRVTAASGARTPKERAEATLDWLDAINGPTGREFCAPGSDLGAPGGGMFSRISNRRQASATPIFRDLAPDVYAVTADLRNRVQQALARAEAFESAPEPVEPAPSNDPGLAPPSFGVSF